MRYPWGRNVLVTGVSSGIGKASALLLASRGFHVWGVARHSGDLPSSIHFHSLDVTNEQDTEKTIAEIDKEAVKETGDHLSLLLCCAGMGIAGSAEQAPIADVRRQFEVNYFGTVIVCKYAMPFLRQNRRSRVLLTSSVGGRIPLPFQSQYASTKFAIEAYGEALRMEASRYHVAVTLIEPGDTKTSFTKERTTVEPKESPYYTQAMAAVQKIAHDEQTGDSPEKVAHCILSLATKNHAPVRKAIGWDSKLEMFLIRILPASFVEAMLKKIYLC